ncbi:hypothetical protein P2318_06960 [Myxococcaceae bacterium GXIMD 01537]
MSHRLFLLLALAVAPLASAQENVVPRAEDLRNLTTARVYGMGGAYRALGQGTEAVLGNPAAIALYKSYRVELTGAWDVNQKDALAGATLMDANTSALAAGLDYHLVSLGRGAARTTAHLGTLAFALPLSESIFIGASGHYLMQRGPREADATTMDAGVLVRLGGAFTVGFSGHNLIDTSNPEFTRYYSGHLGYSTGLLTAAADVRADFVTRSETTFTYNGGLEYILGESIPVRVGYTYDGFTEGSKLGLGFGLMGQGGGIDFAYQHDFSDARGRLVAMTLRLQIY